MISGIDPKVDYAFKRVFGSEENASVLIDLLNAVMQPPVDRQIVDLTITNPFNAKATAADKLSVVDVKARDHRGELYNIEMQMHATPTYPERVLYYWARIYSQQLSEGDRYEKLKPTISISFLNDVLFTEVTDSHLEFRLGSVQHPELIFSEVQTIHVIELPKFRKSIEELGDSFDAWCYFLRNAANLDTDQLPVAMGRPAVRQAMEVLNVISKTDLERERYEAALRWERDHASIVDWAHNAHAMGLKKGLEQGIEQGLEQGLEKGAVIGRIHLCQRLLKLPQSPMATLLEVSGPDLEATAKALESQLAAKD